MASKIARSVFGLSCAVLDCAENTSIDDFGNAILVDDEDTTQSLGQDVRSAVDEGSYFQYRVSGTKFQSLGRSPLPEAHLDYRKIPNVMIMKNLNLASKQVQIQALELGRTRRVFTRTAVHIAPRRFLLIALLSSEGPRPALVSHLNDHIFISHYHNPDDGVPNLEESLNPEFDEDDKASISSVVRRFGSKEVTDSSGVPVFSTSDVDLLISRSRITSVSAEIKRYLQNIVTFLRMHRGVAGGISAHATKHFDLLVKCLAPLHSLDYVTPSLVALAAKKIYPHRIVMATPQDERSMQWGSQYEAVAALLDGLTPEDIIDEVLHMVEVPL
ncbi:MAG: hypothetical protein M1827_001504 [Pycnora praestabilis]|nr:MAG: hypothetical protein M1827_001504 [Pycnora praestabilis]